FWSFLAVLFPIGAVVLTFTTAANSATQLGTTAQMRGRVMGLYLLVFLGGAPLGSSLAGWAGQQFGPRISLIAGGAISAAAAVARHPGVPRRRGRNRAGPAEHAARTGRGTPPRPGTVGRGRGSVPVQLAGERAVDRDRGGPRRAQWPDRLGGGRGPAGGRAA